jgi:hypothetical protein
MERPRGVEFSKYIRLPPEGAISPVVLWITLADLAITWMRVYLELKLVCVTEGYPDSQELGVSGAQEELVVVDTGGCRARL